MNITWFNYKTGEYECIPTPTDFANYIPQIAAAQELYKDYIKMGKSPIEAAKEVWSAYNSEKAN